MMTMPRINHHITNHAGKNSVMITTLLLIMYNLSNEFFLQRIKLLSNNGRSEWMNLE
jgi:hypothetical protein